MLHLIMPTERLFFADMLQELTRKFKLYHDLIKTPDLLNDHPEATYLTYVDDQYGPCGIAFLMPVLKREDKLDTEWRGTFIRLLLPHQANDHALTLLGLRFYDALYREIARLCRSLGIEEISIIEEEEAFKPLFQIGWPIKISSCMESEYLYRPTIGRLDVGAKGLATYQRKYKRFEKSLLILI